LRKAAGRLNADALVFAAADENRGVIAVMSVTLLWWTVAAGTDMPNMRMPLA
jgi:hypothetical protein